MTDYGEEKTLLEGMGDEDDIEDGQASDKHLEILTVTRPANPVAEEYARQALDIAHRALDATDPAAREVLAIELFTLYPVLSENITAQDVMDALLRRLLSLPPEQGMALGGEYNALLAVMREKVATGKKVGRNVLGGLLGYGVLCLVSWRFRDLLSKHCTSMAIGALGVLLVMTLCTAVMILFTNDKTLVRNANLTTRVYDLRETGIGFFRILFVLLQFSNAVRLMTGLWTAGRWYSYPIGAIAPIFLLWPGGALYCLATRPEVQINLWRRPAEGKLARPWSEAEADSASRTKSRAHCRKNWGTVIILVTVGPVGFSVLCLVCGAGVGASLAVCASSVVVCLVGAFCGAMAVGQDDAEETDVDAERTVGASDSPAFDTRSGGVSEHAPVSMA